MRAILDDTLAGWRHERPDLDLDAMATALRLNQLVNTGLRGIDGVFAAHGIKVGEFDVLAALRRAGAGAVLAPTALARVAMVTPGGMTNRLDRLEAAGLIERRPDPDDRRGSLVELTPRGRETADRAIDDLVAAENAVFGVLGATEREHLDRTLDKLLAHLEHARP